MKREGKEREKESEYLVATPQDSNNWKQNIAVNLIAIKECGYFLATPHDVLRKSMSKCVTWNLVNIKENKLSIKPFLALIKCM